MHKWNNQPGKAGKQIQGVTHKGFDFLSAIVAAEAAAVANVACRRGETS